ncbi:hypothetical protein NP233_g8180 [Leucocoprinus birnbaumii]|uniref:Uncharacterized protein n=1 Tax=Leucocoprinus birnbaumii TaxID=56174 RepID=A0AAD5YPA6_9AGAR|nr:hypothetical protein NP233_g8180 [Leucocoprinus birnbaumii]
MADDIPFKPLVNATFLPRWIGRVVRLPCEIISRDGDILHVHACDGGEIEVELIEGTIIAGRIATFTGPAMNARKIAMMQYMAMPDDTDLRSKNLVIEFFHDDRFSEATGYALAPVNVSTETST